MPNEFVSSLPADFPVPKDAGREQPAAYVAAGLFPRCAARLLDCALIGFPCAALRLLLWLRGGAVAVEPILFHWSASQLLPWILAAAYYVLTTGLWGTTPGKAAFGLRVARAGDGGRISLTTALYRETVGRFLTGILWIGYLALAFDAQHRGFHDRLCDTRVVYARGPF